METILEYYLNEGKNQNYLLNLPQDYVERVKELCKFGDNIFPGYLPDEIDLSAAIDGTIIVFVEAVEHTPDGDKLLNITGGHNLYLDIDADGLVKVHTITDPYSFDMHDAEENALYRRLRNFNFSFHWDGTEEDFRRKFDCEIKKMIANK